MAVRPLVKCEQDSGRPSADEDFRFDWVLAAHKINVRLDREGARVTNVAGFRECLGGAGSPRSRGGAEEDAEEGLEIGEAACSLSGFERGGSRDGEKSLALG